MIELETTKLGKRDIMNRVKHFSPLDYCQSSARSEFWGVASRVPSLQATLPPSPQIFSVISDTSCHTPYLFFKNTNCVTPPQIIFANYRRFPPKLNFDFPKTLICSNCKTKRYLKKIFKLTNLLISCKYYFFLCKQKLKDGKWRTVP